MAQVTKTRNRNIRLTTFDNGFHGQCSGLISGPIELYDSIQYIYGRSKADEMASLV